MAPKKNRIKVEQELQGSILEPPPAAMAPKKNRIKVEQELQGSCSHRATPASKPGATRRQKQKKPKKVWYLNKLQNELYTPFAPFVRLVKEITESCQSQVNRWTPEAILCLQHAADYYLNETFFVDLQLAIHPIRASSNLGPQPDHPSFSQAISKDKPNMEFEIEKMFLATTHQVVQKVLHGLDVATLKEPERCAALQLASTSLPRNFASISNIKAMLDKLVAISQQLQLIYEQQLVNIQSVQDLEVKAQEQALSDATAKENARANEDLQAKMTVHFQEAEKIFTNLNQFLSQDN